jgi:hypothetical protein
MDAAGVGTLTTAPRLNDVSILRVNWQRGPALTSSPLELLAWFEAQTEDGKARMTRVPIVLHRRANGWSTTGAQIGALDVHLNDASLGIGIAMRALTCTGERCTFLAEGWWRGVVDGVYEFEIGTASAKALTASACAAITHVEVAHEG